MGETAFSHFWDLVSGAIALSPEAFQSIQTLPMGARAALLVMLLAGLSLAIGQSIVLFVNRVQPLRFILSLGMTAVLLVVANGFWIGSTWLVSRLLLEQLSFLSVFRTLGLAQAPLILSFLVALPYLGMPLFALLSLWVLLAFVAGLETITGAGVWAAFWCSALGWLVFQVLQRTIGQPIAALGRWLANLAAGVQLDANLRQLEELATGGARSFLAAANPVSLAPHALHRGIATAVTQAIHSRTPAGSPPHASRWVVPAALRGQTKARMGKHLQTWLALLLLGLLTSLVVVFLVPLRDWVTSSYGTLHGTYRVTFNLVWIGLIAVLTAGLLAPIEALGWWAGWYGDPIDTQIKLGETVEPLPPHLSAIRYAIYLDGIGQSSEAYLPEVEQFLNQLAVALRDDIVLIRGLMPYSVLNRPLTEDRMLAFFWRWANRLQIKNPASWIGFLINIRNVLIVLVSADQRYGPIYNRGTAQVMYNSLIQHGYKPGSRVPITLIGFSGGGQIALGALPFLKQVLDVPIDVISLGGVMSGNVNTLEAEHLYHLVGDRDFVERLGPIMFPRRWGIAFLSYWNRAKRRGKISIVSLGPVGHQVPGGIMDENQVLPDGRSHMQQAVDEVTAILEGRFRSRQLPPVRYQGNYDRYIQAVFNRPDYYPIQQHLDPDLYQPIAAWMGRLILPKPEERREVQGCWFEVYHADSQHQHLVGQILKLRWSGDSDVQAFVRTVTRDVHLSEEAEYSHQQGSVHPVRINHWRMVDPLESLAGSHPVDDVVVLLRDPVVTIVTSKNTQSTALYINHEPVQISGRFYALVQFVEPVHLESDRFRVLHFNRTSREFDGTEEIVRMPQVALDREGHYPFTNRGIERSPLNEWGWYIYGAQDQNGLFTVRAIAPRRLLQLQPDEIIYGERAALNYLKKQVWKNAAQHKGKVQSMLLQSRSPIPAQFLENPNQPPPSAASAWQPGTCALVLHTYGGIGGRRRETAARYPVYFGHFAYGMARVIWEPLAEELRFDIEYYQVHTHNTEGLIAGTLHWTRYLGDRQFGWLGLRPTCDLLIKLDLLTQEFDILDGVVDGVKQSALETFIRQLQVMTARYRIGDGTGGTFVAAANNCAQDSNQALYAAIRQLEANVRSHPSQLQAWLSREPEHAQRLAQLAQLSKRLKRKLLPFAAIRPDWQHDHYSLGISLEDRPLRNLWMGLGSWRSILPRLANDTVAELLVQQGAAVWVLRSNQIGGNDPNIEPIAPMTL